MDNVKVHSHRMRCGALRCGAAWHRNRNAPQRIWRGRTFSRTSKHYPPPTRFQTATSGFFDRNGTENRNSIAAATLYTQHSPVP